MAIQVVGSRGEHTQKLLVVASVRDIFSNPTAILSQIPAIDQSDLKYSLSSNDTQEFLPIRITELADEDVAFALDIVSKAIGVDQGNLLVQKEGYTLDILVQLKQVISAHDYLNGFFDARKQAYVRLAQEIVAEFQDLDIAANVDTDVFGRDIFLSLPGVPGVKIINNTSEPTDFDLLKRENLFLKAIGLIPDPRPAKIEKPLLNQDKTPVIWNFRVMTQDRSGQIKPTAIEFDKLLKEFDSRYHHMSLKESKMAYQYVDTHWKIINESEVNAFCENLVMPKPTSKECMEFREKIYRTHLKTHDWFNASTFKKINFQNGVLDLETMELLPHNRDLGFLYVLPYSYDPEALSPHFDKHLDDITCGDLALQKILMEFVGYAISNDPVWNQKCLILCGEGNNGKSTFMRALMQLVGEKNYSILSIDQFSKDQYLSSIEGKLFNIAEETPDAIHKSSVFKNIVGGGEVTIKRLYMQPYPIKSRIKTIIACNEMPHSKDATEGFFRRLLIIPFNAQFDDDTRDIDMDKKLEKELPGIFNKALVGYKRLHEQKRFTFSEQSAEIKAEYMDTTDTVRSWLTRVNMEFTENDNDFASSDNLYLSYQNMCVSHGETAVACAKFIARLLKLKKALNGRKHRKRINGVTLRGFKKVRFETGMLDSPHL